MSAFVLKQSSINTPIGTLIALGDEHALYMLQFEDAIKLGKAIEQVRMNMNATITKGTAASILSIQQELTDYFNGTLMHFTTPLFFTGTDFYKKTWQAVTHVPYGKTACYKDVAKAVGTPQGCRAVARANACNQLVIVVPCHRIITRSGKLGGYNAGLWRKEWLVEHEKNFIEY